MLTIGTHLDTLTAGRRVRYRIAAIRRAPFSYVELEPVLGGPRRQLPLHIAERILRATDTSTMLNAERASTGPVPAPRAARRATKR
ncbi:hypothetical protein HH308_11475 [Gordonia sp. TBRC 11910]|uniref:Uncharacterized protein n=1 Tax=Gordonia asplenii TaxID=2725283 RepID=A0A848L040_9ACTN|nr:hypothetical protein [Gordonia asplenii]NMO01831.1 hypothetical protein [Gordonia asplenii]